MWKSKLEVKKQYIPLVACGKLSVRKAAKLIGIAPISVWRLKKRYLEKGELIWIHGNKGKIPHNKRQDNTQLVNFYKQEFPNSPFAVVADTYSVSYSSLYRVLTQAKIVSPKARITKAEKKLHLPRKERECEGELVQLDGSKHDWFMTGNQVVLHGMIDDATHKIIALFFCTNECLLGYYQLLQHCYENYGLPKAVYTDRSSCFFVTKASTEKVSIQEQLAGIESPTTQWQKTCNKLGIQCIAAYSPQAKGRIERLWQTLQGRLPFLFRYHKINTMQEANIFLKDFVKSFNQKFAVPPQKHNPVWQKVVINSEYYFSVREEKTTKADGSFIYHGFKFRLLSPRACRVTFTLCLSERYGVRAYIGGKYYPVELLESLCDVIGSSMPIVEQDLLYRHFYADTHSCIHIAG